MWTLRRPASLCIELNHHLCYVDSAAPSGRRRRFRRPTPVDARGSYLLPCWEQRGTGLRPLTTLFEGRLGRTPWVFSRTDLPYSQFRGLGLFLDDVHVHVNDMHQKRVLRFCATCAAVWACLPPMLPLSASSCVGRESKESSDGEENAHTHNNNQPGNGSTD